MAYPQTEEERIRAAQEAAVGLRRVAGMGADQVRLGAAQAASAAPAPTPAREGFRVTPEVPPMDTAPQSSDLLDATLAGQPSRVRAFGLRQDRPYRTPSPAPVGSPMLRTQNPSVTIKDPETWGDTARWFGNEVADHSGRTINAARGAAANAFDGSYLEAVGNRSNELLRPVADVWGRSDVPVGTAALATGVRAADAVVSGYNAMLSGSKDYPARLLQQAKEAAALARGEPLPPVAGSSPELGPAAPVTDAPPAEAATPTLRTNPRSDDRFANGLRPEFMNAQMASVPADVQGLRQLQGIPDSDGYAIYRGTLPDLRRTQNGADFTKPPVDVPYFTGARFREQSPEETKRLNDAYDEGLRRNYEAERYLSQPQKQWIRRQDGTGYWTDAPNMRKDPGSLAEYVLKNDPEAAARMGLQAPMDPETAKARVSIQKDQQAMALARAGEERAAGADTRAHYNFVLGGLKEALGTGKDGKPDPEVARMERQYGKLFNYAQPQDILNFDRMMGSVEQNRKPWYSFFDLFTPPKMDLSDVDSQLDLFKATQEAVANDSGTIDFRNEKIPVPKKEAVRQWVQSEQGRLFGRLLAERDRERERLARERDAAAKRRGV